jgi:hypothetical protein
MSEVWYVLVDGTVADPAECAPDKSGRLCANGVPVEVRGDVYRSRGVDAEAERAKVKAKPEKVEADMQPETPKRRYKTREVRSR